MNDLRRPAAVPITDTRPEPAAVVVVAYHEATKHHPHRYARALGYMDWDTQPDPFRTFEGAPRVALERVEPTEPCPSFAAAVAGTVPPEPVTASSIAQLFYDSLALSAWKRYQDARWSLRVNPSSGNLHPTEGYLVCGAVEGLLEAPAVCHYSPREHALEVRARLDGALHDRLLEGLPAGTLLVGLTSIHWRESWKYGERAYRYCQHDVGHAVAAISVAAAVLGWRAVLLPSVLDGELARLLGIAGQAGIEAEHPDLLLAVVPSDRVVDARGYRPAPEVVQALDRSAWIGTPAPLSSDHHHWPIIDAVATAAAHDRCPEALDPARVESTIHFEDGAGNAPARPVVRRRRSAVAMDGATMLDLPTFYGMLARTMPGGAPRVCNVLPWAARIHLALFVHRVDDLAPGLYLLARRADAVASLRAALKPEFAWTRPDGCGTLPLYLLSAGDVRRSAAGVSCGQEIASDGAFAVAMVAEMRASMESFGPWFYRCLHWEAGLVGQLLYLGAEAADVRATGIGCFFDDTMHAILGLADATLQSLYHFTVGGAVDDPRLTTESPYADGASS